MALRHLSWESSQREHLVEAEAVIPLKVLRR